MAQEFTNHRLAVTNVQEVVYTVPAATTSVILMAQVANLSPLQDEIEVDLMWLSPGATPIETYLAYKVMVPYKSSLGLVDGKMVLTEGQSVSAECSEADGAHLTLVVLEIS